jgi:hypothetical protein
VTSALEALGNRDQQTLGQMMLPAQEQPSTHQPEIGFLAPSPIGENGDTAGQAATSAATNGVVPQAANHPSPNGHGHHRDFLQGWGFWRGRR